MDAALKAWRMLALNHAGGDQWKGVCVTKLDQAVNGSQSENVFKGLVGRDGGHVNISADVDKVWGIDLDVCYDYCGWDKLQTVFSFQIFSSGATNYLLPWLALTAQLPFETGEQNVIANVMSFCMALGSPMLITYSLMMTILNQHWLRGHFRELERHEHIRDSVKHARMFLQESQQVPLRLSQDAGSLGSLVVLAENKIWWERLVESVQRTRRGVTMSLIAQIIVAIMSWVLTVIAAFLSSLGNPTEALILSGGSLWIWLVPIICGWISVGTQNDHSTISAALKRDEAAVAKSSMVPPELNSTQRSRHFSNAIARTTLRIDAIDQDAISAITTTSEKGAIEEVDPKAGGMVALRVFERQKGFRIAHHRHKMQPLIKKPITDGKIAIGEEEAIPGCFGFSVAGDEKQEGPTFNYARMFTWWHVANQIHHAFERTAINLSAGRDLNGFERRDGLKQLQQDELQGSTLSVLQYCGLANKSGEVKELTEYPEWKELDAAFWQRNMIAVIMAIFVQWGTTGAALTIGYLTEVVGLGCRSGSYLVYGSLGTASFMLLFASSFFSHAAMLQHQACVRMNDNASEEPGRLTRSPPSCLPWLRICAVVTRLLGRVLVVFNTVWLLLISFWELIGFFNNCWCDGVTLSRGDKGFIILFKGAAEMAPAAVPAWAGGVFLSVFVVAASSAIFWLFCRGNRK